MVNWKKLLVVHVLFKIRCCYLFIFLKYISVVIIIVVLYIHLARLTTVLLSILYGPCRTM